MAHRAAASLERKMLTNRPALSGFCHMNSILKEERGFVIIMHLLQLSNNRPSSAPSPTGDPATVMNVAESRQFAQCVENINVLNLRLKNADERCLALREELRRARQVRHASRLRAIPLE